MSLIEKPHIKEHFMGFLEAEESTGQHLASMILTRLEELGIPFEDCRGQSYDNGANMKGKNKGVQARLLEKNPRALFVPCGAHTLNLVVCDAAKGSVDAMSYFGVLQNLYTLFSASTQRWTILKKHVSITLKMWTETRWESKVKSVVPMRYQGAAVREALIEVRDQTKDPAIKAEAQSLSEEVGSYRFSICTVVWYDMLSAIQNASKVMQSPNMDVDLAVSLLKKTERGLQSYRASGFVTAQMAAKDLCEEMNVEAVLKQKRLRSTKRHFSYESHDETITDALKKLEVGFFNVVVDAAMSSIKEKFSTLENVGNKFRILTNFPSHTALELEEQCEALGTTLHFEGHSDLDSKELVQEIRNFPDLPSKNMSLLELITFMHDKDLLEIYPNFWTALRIALTLPVTVAQAERSFSKLKLIKVYLRAPKESHLGGVWPDNPATLAPNVGPLRPGRDTEGLSKLHWSHQPRQRTATPAPAPPERQRRPAEERGGSAATATGNRLLLASPGSSLEQPRPAAPLPGDQEPKAPCSRRRWEGDHASSPWWRGVTTNCSRPSESYLRGPAVGPPPEPIQPAPAASYPRDTSASRSSSPRPPVSGTEGEGGVGV
ncbi:Zinc finger MYM-type protein 1 [Merluccius polli]|uniref:Zinc finger MYM-type protein 1 n=1 Tax=Merluccius polli TaxID=89951 RepID=A0AA47NNC6_MERPO|nr:Zinc finger MYM-type protein 1 [Merluccius polli]